MSNIIYSYLGSFFFQKNKQIYSNLGIQLRNYTGTNLEA